MMLTLIRKLLRDLRLALAVVAFLLGAFQCLWYKVTERVIAELSPFFSTLASLGGLTNKDIQDVLFAGPGKIVRTLVGGDQLDFDSVMDMLSIGYVHPHNLKVLDTFVVPVHDDSSYGGRYGYPPKWMLAERSMTEA